MGDIPKNKGTTQPRPTPPPKPSSALAEVTTKLETLTARFAELEERTTLLYRDQTTLHQKNRQQAEDIVNLRGDLTALKMNYSKLEEDHAKLNDSHTRLQKVYTTLQADHNHRQTQSRKWQQEVATLKKYLEAFQADHRKVLTEQINLKQGQDNLQTEFNNIRAGQQAELNNIRTEQQAEFNNIRAEHQAEIDNIRAQQLTQLSDLKEMFVQKSDVVKDMTSLRQEMTSVSRDVASVKDTSAAQQGHTELHTLQSDLSQLKEDNNKLQTEVSKIQADCSKLTSDQDIMKAEIKASLQEALSSDLTALETRLDVGTLRTGMEQVETSLRESLMKTTSDITALKTTLQEAKPLFEAELLNKDTTQHHGAMLYISNGTNHGGHYNPETGIFTAPCAGLYFFTAAVSSDSKRSVHAFVMVGDDIRCTVSGEKLGASESVMMSLAAGDRVWVMAACPVHQYRSYAVFSGVLVLPYSRHLHQPDSD